MLVDTELVERILDSDLPARQVLDLLIELEHKQKGQTVKEATRFKVTPAETGKPDEYDDLAAKLQIGLDALHESDPAAATDLVKRLIGMLPPTQQQGKTTRSGDLVGWVYANLERGIK